jgi:hypothetical protein
LVGGGEVDEDRSRLTTAEVGSESGEVDASREWTRAPAGWVDERELDLVTTPGQLQLRPLLLV